MLDTTSAFIFLTNFIHLCCGARDFVSQVYDSVNKNYLNFKLEKEIKKEEINYNKNSCLFGKDYLYIQPPAICQCATFHFHVFIGLLFNRFY